MFESFPDSKQQWKIINTQIKEKEKKHDIFNFWNNSIILHDKKQVANTSNNCFSRLQVYNGLKNFG